MNILDYLGSLFGYIIMFGYKISGVYVFGIVLFTIAVKLIMFPMSINQQRTTVKQQRIAPKLREIQEMYRNNQQKMQEETSKVYAREGISQLSGCLPLLIQFPVIIGLYSAITNPLTCVLHISYDKVKAALALVEDILPTGTRSAYYAQINLISQFDQIKDTVASSFTGEELAEIEGLAHGAFNFLGVNLLGTPSFSNALIVVPILCFITSVAMMMLTSFSAASAQQGGGAAAGCTKWGMPIGMSVFMTYIAFSVPGAVGVYWILSNILALVQTWLMNKYYNASIMSAQDEARRYARREQEEALTTGKFTREQLERTIEKCRQQDENRNRNESANENKKKKK